MKTLKEIINFIDPNLIPKLKSFDFWLNIGIVIFGGVAVCTMILLAIKAVEFINP